MSKRRFACKRRLCADGAEFATRHGDRLLSHSSSTASSCARGPCREQIRTRFTGPERTEDRLVAEKLDQFGPLAVAEADDRLCLGDPTVSERTVDPGRADPRYGQKQLAQLRRLRGRGWSRKHLGKFDRARGKLSLQLCACETNLVCPRERKQPLLARARRDCQRVTPTLHRADSTSTQDVRSRLQVRISQVAEPPLFLLDEVTAMAAGHRACALCRRETYVARQLLLRRARPRQRRKRRHQHRRETRNRPLLLRSNSIKPGCLGLDNEFAGKPLLTWKSPSASCWTCLSC